MTPAERARQIEREEFEADCANARKRALEVVAERRAQREAERRKEMEIWLALPIPEAVALHPSLRRTPEGDAPPPPKAPEHPASKAETEGETKVRRRRTQLTYQGETRTVTEWARALNLSTNTIRSRIAYGWPIERVLSAPVQKKRGKKSEGAGGG